MDARKVILVVNGYKKSIALQKCVGEWVNHIWTASALQLYPHSMIVCDEEATAELKVKTVNYFKDIEKSNLEPIKI
jgi:glucosamine-6-phosphate deaminase